MFIYINMSSLRLLAGRCVAVDREREFAYILFRFIYFVICGSPLGGFGGHFAFLWVTLASLWLPWDADGPLWGALGSQGELEVTLD